MINNKIKFTQKYLLTLEENASIIRKSLGLKSKDRLDPRKYKEQLNIDVIYPEDIDNLPEKELDYINHQDAKVWSGISNTLPNGKLLIILNSKQTPERENITILEEYFHAYFNHQPIKINGTLKREYDTKSETEAYQTAAATLLPSEIIAKHVWQGTSAKKLASEYGTSTELVVMRIKVLGLWKEYQKQLTGGY